MYYTLINDLLYDSKLYIHEPDDMPGNIDFISGQYITESINTPLQFTTNGKSGDDLRRFMKSSFPIMSRKFVELLQGAGVDNLQLYPAIVKSEVDGTTWDGYYMVNVLGLISCADLENSKYTEIMPGHYRFKELTIHPDKTNGALLFRLQEHAPTIIVHESVCQYLVDNDPDEKLTGWSVGEIAQ